MMQNMKAFSTVWLALLAIGINVYALNIGDNGEPGMSHAMFPKSLAGCKNGDFYAKGLNDCAGIQGLQCDELGRCMGHLEGKSFHINCNHKHECVTHRWGGELVRKFMSITKDDGSVQWNNGCAWICDDESSSTLVRNVRASGRYWWQLWQSTQDKKLAMIQQIVNDTLCSDLIPFSTKQQHEAAEGATKKYMMLGIGAIAQISGTAEAAGHAPIPSDAFKSFMHAHKAAVNGIEVADTIATGIEIKDSVVELEGHFDEGGEASVALKIGIGFVNAAVFGIAIAGEVLCHGVCTGQIVHTAHWIMAPINAAMYGFAVKDVLDENMELAAFTSKINEKCFQQFVWPGSSQPGEIYEIHLGASEEGLPTTDPRAMVDNVHAAMGEEEVRVNQGVLGGNEVGGYVPFGD